MICSPLILVYELQYININLYKYLLPYKLSCRWKDVYLDWLKNRFITCEANSFGWWIFNARPCGIQETTLSNPSAFNISSILWSFRGNGSYIPPRGPPFALPDDVVVDGRGTGWTGSVLSSLDIVATEKALEVGILMLSMFLLNTEKVITASEWAEVFMVYELTSKFVLNHRQPTKTRLSYRTG